MRSKSGAVLLVAGVLSAAMSVSLYATGSAAAIRNVSMSEDFLRELCARTEFKRSELTRIQQSKYFADLLEYSLENCPAVAAVLTNGATASVLPATADGDGSSPPADGTDDGTDDGT
ncbi:MAG: hypothetical protein KDD81_14265, partial [Rhodobacteraceae bacterium]|nr:hypothetical protein [Paracoccaceae bacterium]